MYAVFVSASGLCISTRENTGKQSNSVDISHLSCTPYLFIYVRGSDGYYTRTQEKKRSRIKVELRVTAYTNIYSKKLQQRCRSASILRNKQMLGSFNHISFECMNCVYMCTPCCAYKCHSIILNNSRTP